MQNIVKLASVLVVAMGMGAASTSAFAMGCLNNQAAMVTQSLTANTISQAPGGGGSATALPPAYNIGHYNALLAEGNACPTTEQSLPLDQQHTPRAQLEVQQQK